MEFERLHPAEQLAIMMRRVYDRGLTSSKGGNLSFKDEEGNIWITPAGIDKQALTSKDIVCVTPEGGTIGLHKPSVELPLHRLIYESSGDIKAVLHAHAPSLVMFSLLHEVPDVKVLPDLNNICNFPGIAKYACPGSETLGRRIQEEFLKGHRAVILENHGVCVGGENLTEVFKVFESFEHTAHVQERVKCLGEGKLLTDAELDVYERSYLREKMPETSDKMDSDKEKEKVSMSAVARVAKRAYMRKLIFGGLGSVSQRVHEGDFVITPEYTDLAYLNPEDIVAVRKGVCEAGKIPSHYAALHQAIYESNPDIGAIISAQPECLMAFAVTNQRMDSLLIPETFTLLKDIPNVSFEEAVRSPEVIVQLIGSKHPLVIMNNIGVVMAGEDVFDAFVSLEVAEDSAYGITSSSAFGTIKLLSDKDVEEIKDAFHLDI